MKLRGEYLSYQMAGINEHALCFLPAAARRILIVPPLFDEMNRVRRMLVQTMRTLAEAGVGSMLIDLPGCNESQAALEAQCITSWRAAVAACAEELDATHIASLRGGTLIDDATGLPIWRLAPVKGSSLLKTMVRTRIAGDKEMLRETNEAELLAQDPVELGGNMLGMAMIASLGEAEAIDRPDVTLRILGQDVAGSTLWLRAEPHDDTAMSAAIAADLDRWSASCGS